MAPPVSTPAPLPTLTKRILLPLNPDSPFPLLIFSYLDRKDVACTLPRLSQAFFHALAPRTPLSATLWRGLYHRHWPGAQPALDTNRDSWLAAYKCKSRKYTFKHFEHMGSQFSVCRRARKKATLEGEEEEWQLVMIDEAMLELINMAEMPEPMKKGIFMNGSLFVYYDADWPASGLETIGRGGKDEEEDEEEEEEEDDEDDEEDMHEMWVRMVEGMVNTMVAFANRTPPGSTRIFQKEENDGYCPVVLTYTHPQAAAFLTPIRTKAQRCAIPSRKQLLKAGAAVAAATPGAAGGDAVLCIQACWEDMGSLFQRLHFSEKPSYELYYAPKGYFTVRDILRIIFRRYLLSPSSDLRFGNHIFFEGVLGMDLIRDGGCFRWAPRFGS